MNVAVCIGSACHLHGSYDVKTAFQRLIEENQAARQGSFRGSFLPRSL